MDMRVDTARSDICALCVDDLDTGTDREVLTEADDLAVLDADIARAFVLLSVPSISNLQRP
jgi:hypothetical protein